jgi:hypothetical protein
MSGSRLRNGAAGSSLAYRMIATSMPPLNSAARPMFGPLERRQLGLSDFARRELIAAAGHPDQNSDADRDRQRNQRTLLGLVRDPLQGVVAHLGADLERLVAKIGRLIDRGALAATEAISNFAQDRPDHFGNLISGAPGAGGRRSAGAFPDPGKLALDGAQMAGNRNEARIKVL